jgi:hypothetical protein
MNDDDYMAVLREELDEITSELNKLRAHRDKQKRLITVLEEERKALKLQKEERIKRSEMLSRVENLQKIYDAKKDERNKAFDKVSDVVKSCNRMLIATGRSPMNLPVYGKYQPKVEHRLKKKAESKNHPMPPSTSPLVVSTRKPVDPLSLPSFHPSREIGKGNSLHTVNSKASSNVVVSGILRKCSDTIHVKPEKSVKEGRRKHALGSKKSKHVQIAKITDCLTATPEDDAKQENAKEMPAKPCTNSQTKSVKEDSQGDMTDFLDAIGYYSPEEEEDDHDDT